MFLNSVKAEWLDDRKMRLLEELVYQDKNDKLWWAKKGSIIDGASIPRFFWRFIGSPFTGKYRRASVIHDVYCVSQVVPSVIIHQLFFDMMIIDGVSKPKALVMFWAVKFFGPKW